MRGRRAWLAYRRAMTDTPTEPEAEPEAPDTETEPGDEEEAGA